MKEGFELIEEDAIVADTMDFFLINKEMCPYFIFYYRKLHPELEDLSESIENLLEGVKYKAINSYTSYEDRLYDGYKDYPRIYCLFLCGSITDISKRISEVCLDIRKYIINNEGDELTSDIAKVLLENLQVKKMELEPINAFLISPFWFGGNIYNASLLGKITNKLWKTKWRNYIEKLLKNSIKEIDDTEKTCMKYVTCDNKEFSLQDITKHISDIDIKNEVEQFLNEKKRKKTSLQEDIKIEKNSEKEDYDDKSDKVSDNEFIENIFKKDYKELSENEIRRIRLLFKKREDLIERILNLPDINNKIYFLIYIGTTKSLCLVWDIVRKSEKYEYYKFILDIYGENFPLKLLRKEVSMQNLYCIKGIHESENEKSIRFLFAVLWNGIIQNKNVSLLKIKDAISNNIIYSVSNWHTSPNSSIPPSDLYKLYTSSIFHPKEKEHIETSDNLFNINYIYSNSNDCLFDIIYEMLSKNNILSKNLKSFVSYSFYHNISKDYYDQNLDGWHIRDYSEASFIYSVLTSWTRNEEIKVEFIEKYQGMLTEGYEAMYLLHVRARIVLNANFIIPKYSEENEKKTRQLLYPKTTFYKLKTEIGIKENIVNIMRIDNDVVWKELWRNVIIKEQLEIYSKYPVIPSPVSIPLEPEYEEYILNRSEDIFASGIDTLMVHEFKMFLFESRKRNIKALERENFLTENEVEKLLELINKANYYGLSDKEIESCLLEEKDEKWWEVIHTRLEAEFMNHIFEKCLLWVIKFNKTELWEGAPWWGMKIFSKSFLDRPTTWAINILKILNENLEEFELLRVCWALGDLREPLGGKVLKELKQVSDMPEVLKIREKIIRQYKLFQRKNLKMGRNSGNKVTRVKKCHKKLLGISQKRFEA